MNYGVIDVGSNTIRLCIYQAEGGTIRLLLNHKTTAGLVGYVKKGRLSAKGIRRACQVLEDYRQTAALVGVEQLFVFATASLRNITNTDEALYEIGQATGLPVDVLTGRQEATYDFMGAARSMEMDRGLMIDIGGGSTELVCYEQGEIRGLASLRVGSLNLFTRHVSGLFPTKKERAEIAETVLEEIDRLRLPDGVQYDDVLGIGGTIRAARSMYCDVFPVEEPDGVIPVEGVGRLLHTLAEGDKQVLRSILQVAPDRIHTLIPGMVALNTICRRFGCRQLRVSAFGVREGYLYQKLTEV